MMSKSVLLILSTIAAFLPAADTPASAVLGRWTNGRISTIQYRDAYTGVSKPPTGTYFSYEFRKDGTYTFSGMMQSTMYNCTSTMFGEESGTYEFADSEPLVVLHPKKNPYRMTNNCAPNSNKESEGKLRERSYRFQVNASKDQLELSGSDGVQVFQRERPQ